MLQAAERATSALDAQKESASRALAAAEEKAMIAAAEAAETRARLVAELDGRDGAPYYLQAATSPTFASRPSVHLRFASVRAPRPSRPRRRRRRRPPTQPLDPTPSAATCEAEKAELSRTHREVLKQQQV